MNHGDNKSMMNYNNLGPPPGKFKMGWKNNGGNFLAPRPPREDNINMAGVHMNLNPSSSSAAQAFKGRGTYLAPRAKWKVRNKAEKRKRKVADAPAVGAIGTSQGRAYEPPRLHELQAQNRLKARKYYPKKKFNRFAPFAPRNTTSFIIQAKRNGGIAELVSPCPVTPAILPTPIISPAREGLADMAKQEWGLYGYGSMKGFIRLKDGDNDNGFEGETRDDDESSSGSDVEEHVEMERRLDHDLSRFVMTYPSTSSPPPSGGFDGPRGLENRVDDQDNHIARLEEENLTLKERLFLMEQEMEDLRRRMMNLESGNPNVNNCAVIDNNNSNVIDNVATDDDAAEVCSEKSVGDGDGEKDLDGKAGDAGGALEAEGSREVAGNASCD